MKKKLILKNIFFCLASIHSFNLFASNVSSASLINALDLAREVFVLPASKNITPSSNQSPSNQGNFSKESIINTLDLAREISISQSFINSISTVSNFQKIYNISPSNTVKQQAILPGALSSFSFNINAGKSSSTSPGSSGAYAFIQDPWNKVSTEFAAGKGVAVTIPDTVQQSLFENFSNDQIYLSIIATDKTGNYIPDLTKEMPEYFYLYLFGTGFDGELLAEPIPFSVQNAIGVNSVSFKSNQFTMSGFGLSNITLSYPFILNIQNRLVYNSQPAVYDLQKELTSLEFNISNGSASYPLSFIQAAAGSSLASDLSFIPTLTKNFVLAVYGYDSLNNTLYTLDQLKNAIQSGSFKGFIAVAYNESGTPLAAPVNFSSDVTTSLKNIFTSGNLTIGLNINGSSVTSPQTITYPMVIDLKNIANFGAVIYDIGNTSLNQLSLNFGTLNLEFIGSLETSNSAFISALKRIPTSTQEFSLELYGYEITTINNNTTSSPLSTLADLQAAIKNNALIEFYFYVYDSNNTLIGNPIPVPSSLVNQIKTALIQSNVGITLTVNNILDNQVQLNYPLMVTIKNISGWSGSQFIDTIDLTKMTLQQNLNLNYNINTDQGDLQLTLNDGSVQGAYITPIAVTMVNGQPQQPPIQPANCLVITKSEKIQVNSKYSSITLKSGATIKDAYYSSSSTQSSLSSFVAPLNNAISTLQDDQYIVITMDQYGNLNIYASTSSASTNASAANSSGTQPASAVATVNYDVQNKPLTDFSFTITNGSASLALPFIYSSKPVVSDLSFLNPGMPQFTVQLYGYSADASGGKVFASLSDLQAAVQAKKTIKFLIDILDFGTSMPVADDIALQLQNILGTGNPSISLTVNSAQAATSSAITYPISVNLQNISNFRQPIFDLENEEMNDLSITLSNGTSSLNLSCVQSEPQTTFISPLNFVPSGSTGFSLDLYSYTTQGILPTKTDYLDSFANGTYQGLGLYAFDQKDISITDGIELPRLVSLELNKILRGNSFTLLAQVGSKVLNVVTGATYPVQLTFKNIANWGNPSYDLEQSTLTQISFDTVSGKNLFSLTPANLTIIPARTSRFKLELYGYDTSNISLQTFDALSTAISNKTLSGFALGVYGPQYQSLGTVPLSLSADQVAALGSALISQTDYVTLGVNGQKNLITSGFTYPLFVTLDNIRGWNPPAQSTSSTTINVAGQMYAFQIWAAFSKAETVPFQFVLSDNSVQNVNWNLNNYLIVRNEKSPEINNSAYSVITVPSNLSIVSGSNPGYSYDPSLQNGDGTNDWKEQIVPYFNQALGLLQQAGSGYIVVQFQQNPPDYGVYDDNYFNFYILKAD